VAINCGGIPENLLESELFGHKKGAFTGAVEDKEGLFVVASGGTLFLDEIGEMPLSLQVRLLRVLDSSSVLPVGGVSETKVDVRIISATNRNLDNMVKEGTFRKDLFYRLNVIPLNLPALRERIDDIPLLALHFVEVHSGRLGRRNIVLSEHAEEILRAFDWPGNVRELENVMERAVALCSGSRIEVADLPQELQHMAMELPEVPLELPAGGIDMEKLVADVEINLIRQALQKSHYCQKKAAILLGLSARSLRYRLQKYGIEEG
jgi:two-component system response regulator PilR (NtrC family)